MRRQAYIIIVILFLVPCLKSVAKDSYCFDKLPESCNPEKIGHAIARQFMSTAPVSLWYNSIKFAEIVGEKSLMQDHDDFSTPKAIAAIFSFIKQSNKDLNEDKIIIDDLLAIKHWFADISQILGIDFFDNDDKTSGDEEELLNIIADVRQKLRAEKQYDLSDEIRDKLVSLGIEVSD